MLLPERHNIARAPPRGRERGAQRVGREPHLERGSHLARAGGVELGDEEPRRLLALVAHRARDVVDVVEHVGAEDRVEREAGEGRVDDVEMLHRDVRMMDGVEARAQVGERRRVRVDGVDVAGRAGQGGEPEREVSRPAADVGDAGARPAAEQVPVAGDELPAQLLAAEHPLLRGFLALHEAPKDVGYISRQGQPAPMQVAQTQTAVAVTDRTTNRDWVAWYDELEEMERREIRGRLLTAAYDEVKEDPELRQFFFFHSEEIAGEEPGTERLAELHGILSHLRGSADAEVAERRRKAVHFLLAEYQKVLRDNPWTF